MYILVAALKEEITELLVSEKDSVVISGLGKLKSLMTMTEAFQSKHRPIGCVVNLGTAGSDRISPGSLVEVNKSFQRDTSFFSDSILLNAVTDLPKAACGTGDRLEPLSPKDPWDIVDMELYSLAFYCQQKSIPLVSIKYVTDRNNIKDYKDWKRQLPSASAALSQFWMAQKPSVLSHLSQIITKNYKENP